MEISITASRRYHGNHQEMSMSIDEAQNTPSRWQDELAM